MKHQLQSRAYLPVVYRGVKGIFVPETALAKSEGRLYETAAGWRRYPASTGVSPEEVESAIDVWSVLVRDEVKKALDDYDLLYRVATELEKRGF